ncbi:hypothetical protein G5I_08048 [Acromyrmex echinatior]|uniref:Uncharacterized protein n=1 Tax=Acromyrmex echinatior TaxID=103372 RepID=F4WQK3_ACREC|nr:hypothetical protein G5I_08048 [Acromyrmex echinatior]
MPGTGKEESVFQIDTLLFDPSRFFVRALRELYRVSRRSLADTKNEQPTGDRPWYAVQQVDIDWRRYDEKEETQARKISIIQH